MIEFNIYFCTKQGKSTTLSTFLLFKIKYSKIGSIRNCYINKLKRQLAFRSLYHIIHLLAFDIRCTIKVDVRFNISLRKHLGIIRHNSPWSNGSTAPFLLSIDLCNHLSCSLSMIKIERNDEHIFKRKFTHFPSHTILCYSNGANLYHEIMLQETSEIPQGIFMQRVFFIQQANEKTCVQQYAILFNQASPPLTLVNHSSAFTPLHFGVALRIKPCR